MGELYAWVFMRASGVVLLFLALGHLAMMHIVNDTTMINYAFVMQRWSNPIWRVYDWFLLGLGTLHGVNGLRVVVEDHVRRDCLRQRLLMLLYTIGALLLISGSIALITVP